MHKKSNKLWPALKIVSLLLLLVGLVAYYSAKWYLEVYGDLGFDAVLYTLFATNEGVEISLVLDYLTKALVPSLIVTVFLAFVFLWQPKRQLVLRYKQSFRVVLYPFHRLFSVITAVVLTVILTSTAVIGTGADVYIKQNILTKTTFIENNYVDPDTVDIVFPDEKRNLIYIYLESMETTFLSRELGGGCEENYIPELYALANDNINFSHDFGVGGFRSLSGGLWTIGAMVSSSAGVPLKTPFNLNGNEYGKEGFLPGITTLSDILHENGYYQTLMVGSDANFGGRRQYYEEHGADKVYDYYTAIEDGIIPGDYYVWWGMEDYYLFEYAKQELSEISKQESPFAFSMLTVDTHHLSGYVCELCGDAYGEQYENVLACQSRQVAEFVDWLQQQDFYENTTVIITGDHPTMDNDYIERNVDAEYMRRVYNCFINSATSTDYSKNREYCTHDLFPTTLAAIGCTIEGERLALGTNLFSGEPTLCEQLGTDKYELEISNNSSYYDKKFLQLPI